MSDLSVYSSNAIEQCTLLEIKSFNCSFRSVPISFTRRWIVFADSGTDEMQEVVRHGSCPTNSVSCLGKSPTGRCPTRKVIDRKLSETDYPVSCGLPILTNSRGTKAILVSFHDVQSGCGAHTSSLSCRPFKNHP